MKRKSLEQRQKDAVRVLIEEAKIKNNLGDIQLSQYLGITTRTLSERKRDPGPLTLDKIIIIAELAEKEVKLVEKLQ